MIFKINLVSLTIFFWSFFIAFLGTAQTFNKRFDFAGFQNADGLTNIEESSQGYLVVGSSQFNQQLSSGIWSIALNQQGELINESFFTDSTYTWHAGWRNGIQSTVQGNFILGGSSSEPNVIALVALLDAYSDTLWTKKIIDPLATEGHCHAAIQCFDGGYLIVGSISYDGLTSHGRAYKLNAIGELEWSQLYNSNNHESIYTVARLSDGGYLLGGMSKTAENNYDDWLLKISEAGEQIWSTIYPGIADQDDGSANLVNNIDDSFIFATSRYTSEFSAFPTIIKVNPDDGSEIWSKTYGPSTFQTFLASMESVNGNDGYIACGMTYDDSLGVEGLLLRINEYGDSLWMRKYQWLAGELSLFYDVIPSSNGGFVAVGTVESDDDKNPSQDAWVIKTDEHGCIVPGCEVGVEELGIDHRLLIYPNPANDIVNFHFSSKAFLNRAQLEILDITGKTVLVENFSASEITLMMDASKLPGGLYFVRVVSEGEVLLTEKLEKW